MRREEPRIRETDPCFRKIIHAFTSFRTLECKNTPRATFARRRGRFWRFSRRIRLRNSFTSGSAGGHRRCLILISAISSSVLLSLAVELNFALNSTCGAGSVSLSLLLRCCVFQAVQGSFGAHHEDATTQGTATRSVVCCCKDQKASRQNLVEKLMPWRLSGLRETSPRVNFHLRVLPAPLSTLIGGSSNMIAVAPFWAFKKVLTIAKGGRRTIAVLASACWRGDSGLTWSTLRNDAPESSYGSSGNTC
jgi:hypothetical protein